MNVTVAILDKVPLFRGGKFEVGWGKDPWLISHARMAASPPRTPLLRERRAQDHLQHSPRIVRREIPRKVRPSCLRFYWTVKFAALRDTALERAVLGRCHKHLVSRGFGVLELAPLTWTIARRWVASLAKGG